MSTEETMLCVPVDLTVRAWIEDTGLPIAQVRRTCTSRAAYNRWVQDRLDRAYRDAHAVKRRDFNGLLAQIES